MTVAQLIKQLEQHDPDTKVVVRGYEDGFNAITQLKTHILKPHPEVTDYYGEFIDVEAEDITTFKAIELFGKNNKL